MEIKPEADSNDTAEYSENDNTCAGMFTVSDAVFFTFNCHLTCTLFALFSCCCSLHCKCCPK